MAKKPDPESENETVNETDVVAEEASSSDAATDAVFTEDEFTAEPDTPAAPSRILGLLSFIAMLMAPIALTGVMYLAFNEPSEEVIDDGDDAYLAELSDAVDANESAIRQLQNTTSAFSSRSGVSAAEVAATEQRLVSRLRSLEPVPERILRLERSFSALQGISTGVQDTWLLAETEYYLQIANAQLQLAGNPHLATLALKLADERLVQLANPALTNVRAALNRELQALAVTEMPDIEGATLTLGSIANLVDSLPLRQEVQPAAQDGQSIDPELTGVDRALASLKGAVGEVVTVRRTDEAIRPLIAPEAVYFLRANLALQLQAARLALLRGEQAVFRESLDDANAWLQEYYDIESAPVRGAMATIREIRDTSFVSAVPDISESLSLLRQHSAFEDATRESAPVPQQRPESVPAPESEPEREAEPEAEPESEAEPNAEPAPEPDLETEPAE